MSVDWFDLLPEDAQEAILEERREEERQKEKEAINGLADALGLSEGCRKCPWFYETAEGFLYTDHQLKTPVGSIYIDYQPTVKDIIVEQMDYLRIMCIGCKGKDTGKINPEHEERLQKEYDEFREWLNGLGLKSWRCDSCPNAYRVYGYYKDPDDEWKAIEDLCCKCKYFGEGV